MLVGVYLLRASAMFKWSRQEASLCSQLQFQARLIGAQWYSTCRPGVA